MLSRDRATQAARGLRLDTRDVKQLLPLIHLLEETMPYMSSSTAQRTQPLLQLLHAMMEQADTRNLPAVPTDLPGIAGFNDGAGRESIAEMLDTVLDMQLTRTPLQREAARNLQWALERMYIAIHANQVPWTTLGQMICKYLLGPARQVAGQHLRNLDQALYLQMRRIANLPVPTDRRFDVEGTLAAIHRAFRAVAPKGYQLGCSVTQPPGGPSDLPTPEDRLASIHAVARSFGAKDALQLRTELRTRVASLMLERDDEQLAKLAKQYKPFFQQLSRVQYELDVWIRAEDVEKLRVAMRKFVFGVTEFPRVPMNAPPSLMRAMAASRPVDQTRAEQLAMQLLSAPSPSSPSPEPRAERPSVASTLQQLAHLQTMFSNIMGNMATAAKAPTTTSSAVTAAELAATEAAARAEAEAEEDASWYGTPRPPSDAWGATHSIRGPAIPYDEGDDDDEVQNWAGSLNLLSGGDGEVAVTVPRAALMRKPSAVNDVMITGYAMDSPGAVKAHRHSYQQPTEWFAPLCGMIPIDPRVMTDADGMPLYAMGGLAEGSCFFHLSSFATSPEYRSCYLQHDWDACRTQVLRLRCENGVRDPQAWTAFARREAERIPFSDPYMRKSLVQVARDLRDPESFFCNLTRSADHPTMLWFLRIFGLNGIILDTSRQTLYCGVHGNAEAAGVERPDDMPTILLAWRKIPKSPEKREIAMARARQQGRSPEIWELYILHVEPVGVLRRRHVEGPDEPVEMVPGAPLPEVRGSVELQFLFDPRVPEDQRQIDHFMRTYRHTCPCQTETDPNAMCRIGSS